MANKIITIGNAMPLDTSSNLTSQEVYKDISMISEHSYTSKYRIGKLVNVNAIKNSLHQIFTWIPGERILLPEFRSNLRKLLYEGITDFNVEHIVAAIRHSVSECEPRV